MLHVARHLGIRLEADAGADVGGDGAALLRQQAEQMLLASQRLSPIGICGKLRVDVPPPGAQFVEQGVPRAGQPVHAQRRAPLLPCHVGQPAIPGRIDADERAMVGRDLPLRDLGKRPSPGRDVELGVRLPGAAALLLDQAAGAGRAVGTPHGPGDVDDGRPYRVGALRVEQHAPA